jgi:uncharacterized protein (DUF697 family)
MSIYGNIKNIKSVNKALDAIRKEAERPVSIVIMANPQVEADIVRNLRANADQRLVFGLSELKLEADREARLAGADLAIAIVDIDESHDQLEAVVRPAYRARSRLIFVTGGAYDQAFANKLQEAFKTTGDDIIFIPAMDRLAIDTVLIPAIVHKFPKKKLALAAKLPLFRDRVVDDIIANTAKQNAAIGVAVFVPGADMPLLTLNQVKMVLRIAAAYGEELSIQRLNEVLAVVGGGFVLRAVARQILGFIPVAGWAIKGGIAYGGTLAVGEGAKRYLGSRPAGARKA